MSEGIKVKKEDYKFINDLTNQFVNIGLDTLIDSKKHNNSFGKNIDFFKETLSKYYLDEKFSELLREISIKDITPVQKYNNFFGINLQTTSKDPIFLGPLSKIVIDDDVANEKYLIDFGKMAIPMHHYHINNKSNFIQDHFYYIITGKEEGPVKVFLNRVRQLDNRLKELIKEYISNINKESPIYSLLEKNKVTVNDNWLYQGIITEFGDKDYLNICYYKNSFNKEFKIGTRIYDGENMNVDIMNQLGDDTKNTFIHGNIYPVFKVSNITVYEKKEDDKTMVLFKVKPYFGNIMAKKGTLHYGIAKNDKK